MFVRCMRGPSPLYIEERHRALGRDATFSWSRALTHPPRCNRTRHRGRHLDFVGAAILVSWGPPSWIGSRGGRHLGSEVVGAAILDRKSWGPPSWTGSDVKNAKVGPILLELMNVDQSLRMLFFTRNVLRSSDCHDVFDCLLFGIVKHSSNDFFRSSVEPVEYKARLC